MHLAPVNGRNAYMRMVTKINIAKLLKNAYRSLK